jgi:hypothetical protein
MSTIKIVSVKWGIEFKMRFFTLFHVFFPLRGLIFISSSPFFFFYCYEHPKKEEGHQNSKISVKRNTLRQSLTINLSVDTVQNYD